MQNGFAVEVTSFHKEKRRQGKKTKEVKTQFTSTHVVKSTFEEAEDYAKKFKDREDAEAKVIPLEKPLEWEDYLPADPRPQYV